MKIFVSYTLRDGAIDRRLLTKIKRHFEDFGEVFVDLLDNHDPDQQQRVMLELERCDCILLLETPRIHLSKWVRMELARGIERKIPIISESPNKILSDNFNLLSNLTTLQS
mgnify:CR=1 FL=1